VERPDRNSDNMLDELDEPYVLISEKNRSSIQDLLPLLEAVVQFSIDRTSHHDAQDDQGKADSCGNALAMREHLFCEHH
jgi:hypothetical protein